MPAWLGPLLSAAGTVIGSAMNRNSPQASVNDQSGKHFWKSIQFNRKEAKKARTFSAKQSNIDRRLQTKFAKNAAGWQMADLMEAADAAGIHRLSAIGGATGGGYTPAGAGGIAAQAPADSGGYGLDTEAIGGSIVGDGMSAIGDYITGQQQAAQEAKAVAAEGAREDAIVASEVDRNSAEAEMYRARARTEIFNAQNFRGYTGNDGDPTDIPRRRTNNVEIVQTADGSQRQIVKGTDLDEILGGVAIEGWDKLMDMSGAVNRAGQRQRSEAATRHQNRQSVRW